ncbi:MotA/TolQ/ExbB proton channel family protein [Agarivorans sp.]|uniref:MotA/TolQ/ExbB proton channel family protein n=1 Tax=Agarivorans sp. TaxID=1872412 RepID=UPI003D0492C4
MNKYYQLVAIGLSLLGLSAQAASPSLLQQTQQQNQQREQGFVQRLQQQQQQLEATKQRLLQAQQQQQQLQQQFQANERAISEQQQQLQQQSGQLGPVFDLLKQKAEESQTTLRQSLLSSQYPQWAQQLEFAPQRSLVSAQDMQELSSTLVKQLQASGTISFFDANFVDQQGELQQQTLLRIGSFNIINQQGEYLEWQSEAQQLRVYPSQPATQQLARDYYTGKATQLLVDPSRGQLLRQLDYYPSLSERVQQGGKVGWVIIALACIGLAVALYRIIRLLLTERAVRRQLTEAKARANNPLGRVLLAASAPLASLEQLELQVDQAILLELPQLERGQSLVKLFAAVTPLLGLLGTVVGMIVTFQSISLFGNGDPKLLASGISQALVTTVLGLVAAIPLLFCSSLLNSRSRLLLQLMQQKSLAMLAQQHRAEQPAVKSN